MKTAEETLMAWHNPPFGLDVKTTAEITNAMKEFALEVAKEALRNAAKYSFLRVTEDNKVVIDKESILSHDNIPEL